jgi:radical SAM superfamily enzyme YgiQ (UPF0313 family)
MASALLIYPWIYDFAAYDLWLKPLGLLYIASMLRSLGVRVNFIDCLDRYHKSFSSLGKSFPHRKYGCGKYYYEEVEKPSILKKFPRRYKRYGLPVWVFIEEIGKLSTPDIILVSSGMTYWYPGVVEAINLLKMKFPKVPIILGGAYATLCYQHALNYSGADYVFKGGNVNSLLKLIENIIGDGFTRGKSFLDFSSYSYPAYDLYRKNEYVALRTSVGCPFACTYCAVNLLSERFAQRKPELVAEEIEYFYKILGVRNFVFYDDSLLFNEQEHFRRILELILESDLNCLFHTPNGLQARFLTYEGARLMRRVGFINPRLSLETVNEKRQMASGNKVTSEEVEQALRYLEEAGYSPGEVGIYVMMGMPDQPFEEVYETMQFVHRLRAKILLVEYSPIPGTKEWEKSGLEDNLDPLLHNNSLFPLYDVREWKEFQKLKDEAQKLNQKL